MKEFGWKKNICYINVVTKLAIERTYYFLIGVARKCKRKFYRRSY